MRAAVLLGLALTGCAAPRADGGIVSINPCADAMLVELVPPGRIAAISRWSREPDATSIPLDLARRLPVTSGTAEDVIARAPSLVVASSFTAPATRAAFARAGVKALYLDSPDSIAASQAQVAELAAAVGAPARGAAINARIDQALAAAARSDAPVPALLWIGGNLVSGGGTLLDEMMRHAGFRDAAAEYGLQQTGSLPVERLVAQPPRVMLVPEAAGRDAGSRTAALRARILAHVPGIRQASFSRSLINCGGPVIPRALRRLAAIRRAVTA